MISTCVKYLQSPSVQQKVTQECGAWLRQQISDFTQAEDPMSALKYSVSLARLATEKKYEWVCRTGEKLVYTHTCGRIHHLLKLSFEQLHQQKKTIPHSLCAAYRIAQGDLLESMGELYQNTHVAKKLTEEERVAIICEKYLCARALKGTTRSSCMKLALFLESFEGLPENVMRCFPGRDKDEIIQELYLETYQHTHAVSGKISSNPEGGNAHELGLPMYVPQLRAVLEQQRRLRSISDAQELEEPNEEWREGATQSVLVSENLSDPPIEERSTPPPVEESSRRSKSRKGCKELPYTKEQEEFLKKRLNNKQLTRSQLLEEFNQTFHQNRTLNAIIHKISKLVGENTSRAYSQKELDFLEERIMNRRLTVNQIAQEFIQQCSPKRTHSGVVCKILTIRSEKGMKELSYTKEQEAFLEKNVKNNNFTTAQLAEKFNRKFNTNRTPSGIFHKISRIRNRLLSK